MKKYRASLFTDEYGKINDNRFKIEAQYFTREIFAPEMYSLIDSFSVNKDYPHQQIFVDNVISKVRQWHLEVPHEASIIDGYDTPLEFEQWCANQLIASGWNAKLTKAVGDKGVDVIAEKDGFTIVLQCKMWGAKVGNKGVQEAIAGREHEGADLAAVVATNGFTTSAKQLANRTEVLLLSPEQLKEFKL